MRTVSLISMALGALLLLLGQAPLPTHSMSHDGAAASMSFDESMAEHGEAMDRRDPVGAIPFGRRAHELKPDDQPSTFAYGKALYLASDKEKNPNSMTRVNLARLEKGLRLLTRAAEQAPQDFNAIYWRAQALADAGRTAEALAQYTVVVREALDMEQDAMPFGVKAQIANEAMLAHIRLEQWAGAKRLFRRIRKRWPELVWRRALQLPANFFDESLRGLPFWDNTEELGAVAKLEANYAEIRAELDAALARPAQGGAGGAFGGLEADFHLLDSPADTSAQIGWAETMLYRNGEFEAAGCALFPRTCAIVSGIPELTGRLQPRGRGGGGQQAQPVQGQVTIFRLMPGTHLRAHFGPVNVRLTVHLGLIVPDGVAIRVGGSKWRRSNEDAWAEGKVMAFDDSFVHEVWHNGTEPRYVLYASHFHPDLFDRMKLLPHPKPYGGKRRRKKGKKKKKKKKKKKRAPLKFYKG